MSSLVQYSRRKAIMLALAFGLAVLPGIISPVLSDDMANVLPGVTNVFADDTELGGG